MQLFPAIDLRGGKVVRLTQGDYSRMTVYGEDPCAQARQFLTAGAKNLHVVDLDGAKDGTLSNYDTIAALAKQGGLYIEVGGGIRTEERIENYLSLGVGRCILGSVAVTCRAPIWPCTASWQQRCPAWPLRPAAASRPRRSFWN